MLLIVSLTFSLVLWVILWALGAKALDGFLLIVLIMVSAVAAHIIGPMLPGKRRAGRAGHNSPGSD